ncbi:MAG: plasmid pRiA4b ORF-3 family protein [Pseudonocardia sp.]|nr:plasmid pRiA4b ORF-3 family protein [Pseudonocardia sp.]
MAARGTTIAEIEIVLEDVRPPVRRVVQVPGDVSLAGLHETVQAAVGWTDSHLHEFEIGGRRYGVPDPEDPDVADDGQVTLLDLVGPGSRFGYRYDFGDDWAHRLTVEKIVAAEPGVRYPRCVSGSGACPPEDVGGPAEYDEFQVVLADPAHPNHHDLLEWLGGPFDPHRFDLAEANRALGRLTRARP